jgi:hypothetical protein
MRSKIRCDGESTVFLQKKFASKLGYISTYEACLRTSTSCVRDVILCSDYLFQSMERDDKIYVGKILAAGFVPLYLLQLNIATDYGLLNIAWSTTVISDLHSYKL